MERIILAIAGIYFLSHVFAAIFSRTRVPDVLLLTLMGMVIGPFTGSATRADFGVVGDVLSAMALVIILFEGGISIKLAEVRRILPNSIVLTVLTFAVTTLVVANATMYFLDFDLFSAVLTGVILGGVSPAVIIPMAKGLKLSNETFATLSIECALSDVLAVTMAFGFLLAAGAGHIDALTISSDTLLSLLVGALIGAAGGLIWLALLNTIRGFPNTTLTTIGFLLLISAATDTLHLSGAISAFFFGLMLANYHELLGSRVQMLRGLSFTSISESEHAIFQELIFILKTFFFVYLGISVTMEYTLGVWIAAGIVAVIGLLRILVVRASLPPRLGWREMGVVSQMFPKGLAAAVLASVPAEQGLLLGDALRGVVYSVLIFSIIWTTVLVPLIERTRAGRLFQRAFGKAASEAA